MPKKITDIDKHVGQRIRGRRMMIGLSQEKLADLIGLTFQQVQKYEKGSNGVRASRLHDIAGALEVPVAFFFEGAPPTGKPTPAADAESPAIFNAFWTLPYAGELAGYYQRLPNLSRRIVADVARGLAGAEAGEIERKAG